jgi:hypothetical protein
MTTQLRCPICSSENVYSLLNTLHCKRCGNMWKVEKKNSRTNYDCRSPPPVNNIIWTKKNTETVDTKMEKKLNEYLKKNNGTFCVDKIPWNIGDITMTLFRRYLKICVKNKTLVEKKDRYGIVWYSRPD